MTPRLRTPLYTAARVMLALAAMISTACIVGGGILYTWIVTDWTMAGRPLFSGMEMLGWAAGLISVGVVCLGIVLAGIILRYVPWSRAASASGLLAILSVILIFLSLAIFSNLDVQTHSLDLILVKVLAFASLVSVSLPPLLHWMRTRQATIASRLPGGN